METAAPAGKVNRMSQKILEHQPHDFCLCTSVNTCRQIVVACINITRNLYRQKIDSLGLHLAMMMVKEVILRKCYSTRGRH